MKKRKSGIKEQSATTNSSFEVKRRDFFKLLGGGIVIYIGTRNPSELLALPLAQRREIPTDYNEFLTIQEDGTITCHVGVIEMGQGPITSLPQQVADELDVSLESVKMVMGDTRLCSYMAGTWGSVTTRQYSNHVRAACAEARAVLLQLGSEHLETPLEDLKLKNGTIFSSSNPKEQVSFGELAKGKRIERFLDEKPDVKDHTQFKYVGQSRHRADSIVKVTGDALFSGDIKLPGMLYAKVVRPPSHQVELVSIDYSEAEKMDGVQVVRDGDLIAILHELPDVAERALATVNAKYTTDEKEVDDETIFKYLLSAPSNSREVDSEGDLGQGEHQADHIFESEYHDGYKSHSPIEPHSAVAHWEGEKVTVWGSCQSPFGAQGEIARTMDLELENVRVISPFVGGGFGGKIYHPQVIEVTKLAKLAQKPVKILYSREEEFYKDYFRPATVIKIKSGVTNSGKITLWDFNQYHAGMRGSDTIYNVANAKRTSIGEKEDTPVHLFNTGAWRAPHNNSNTFARESQIDIMAARAGIDPVQFRLDNLTDEKMIKVVEALADKFDYKPAAGPSGRGIGMALGTDAGTWVAVMIEVKVDKKSGKVQPIRAVCSQDKAYFVDMVFTHMGIIYKICNLYAAEDDQEDLKQEIIYQLWKSYPSFKGESKFQSWMYRVALNTAMLGLRANKVKYTSLSDHDIEISDDQIQGSVEDSKVRQLYIHISKLNDLDKTIIFLYLEQCSYEEIAEITGITIKNVSVRLVRIREKLRKLFNVQRPSK